MQYEIEDAILNPDSTVEELKDLLKEALSYIKEKDTDMEDLIDELGYAQDENTTYRYRIADLEIQITEFEEALRGKEN